MRTLRLASVPLGFAVACLWITFNTGRWKQRDILWYDSDGYYLYLPAAIIHHDLTDLAFLDSVPANERLNYRFGMGSFTVPETGHRCDRYTMGVALSELPFFLIAHAWMLVADPAHADGYAPVYHLAIACSSIFWAAYGLTLLLLFVRRYTSLLSATIAVGVIAFGTNLFYYSSLGQGMSHPWLFFLCAALLDRTDRWLRTPLNKYAWIIGLLIGLATLTRPTCALFALIPLVWSFSARGSSFLLEHARQVMTAAAIAVLCFLPQNIYWSAVAGHPFFYSYENETFHFSDPHILDGLFSFRKGWFIYTPLAFFGVLSCIALVRDRSLRPYLSAIAIFFAAFLYVTFSWWSWWYGGSFGSRAMIETLPLLALPMAMLLHRMRGTLRSSFIAIGVLFIVLNLFQQWQYKQDIIVPEHMTAERYWAAFGKTSTEGLPAVEE